MISKQAPSPMALWTRRPLRLHKLPGSTFMVVRRSQLRPSDPAFRNLLKNAYYQAGAALMSTSFCERINSCSNLVVTDRGKLCLGNRADRQGCGAAHEPGIYFMCREYPLNPQIPQGWDHSLPCEAPLRLRHRINVCFSFCFYFYL